MGIIPNRIKFWNVEVEDKRRDDFFFHYWNVVVGKAFVHKLKNL